MIPHVIAARHIGAYTLWIRFDDGFEGEVDLAGELYGPVFEPLKDIEVFRRFQVHPELRTIVWPNGADLAPEYLRTALKIAA